MPKPISEGLNSVVNGMFRLFDVVLVLLLASMVAMVFGNVVLRYGFNSGITVSEELSRFAFVWLAFLGAVVGFRERTHLGAGFLTAALGPRGRRICFVASSLVILWSCALIFWGIYRQHEVNMANYAPVTGLPMEFVYASAYVLSIGIAALVVGRLCLLATGRLGDRELFETVDEEERRALEDTPPAVEVGKAVSTR